MKDVTIDVGEEPDPRRAGRVKIGVGTSTEIEKTFFNQFCEKDDRMLLRELDI